MEEYYTSDISLVSALITQKCKIKSIQKVEGERGEKAKFVVIGDEIKATAKQYYSGELVQSSLEVLKNFKEVKNTLYDFMKGEEVFIACN